MAIRNLPYKAARPSKRMVSPCAGCVVVYLLACGCASGQPQLAAVDAVEAAGPVVVPLNEERIAGIIPDYQTVRNSHRSIAPMTAREKWNLGWRETVDPFNIASATMTAAMSQADNQTPKYGEGGAAFARRWGASQADFATQNFFSAGVFATLLHQDPRYFRMGTESRIPGRVLYSLSRLLVARQDSGKSAFNASNIFGMMLGILRRMRIIPGPAAPGP